MSNSTDFSNVWDSLTEPQHEAANFYEGALVLLAGPGSGKTRVLTARIARLAILTRGKPGRILALTFTNRAADEMRTRIFQLAPNCEDRVFVGTFHSFAVELLRQSGTALGIKTDFRIYSKTSDRILLLQRSAERAGVPLPASAEKVLPILDRLRDQLRDADNCVELFADEEQGTAYANSYRAFNDYMTSENALDVGALIYWAWSLLSRFPVLAKRYGNTYRQVCVDEFQDTNFSQYQLLRLLVPAAEANIMVVADDDQLIYQWNGAHHKRLAEFIENYKPAILQLPTNFRCPSLVVEIANRLVSHNKLRNPRKKNIVAGKAPDHEDQRVRLFSYADENDEADGIAKDIEVRHPTRREGVVVIARTRAVLERVHQALSGHGIKSQIAQRKDSFESLPYLWLQTCLNLSVRRTDDALFETFCDLSDRLMQMQSERTRIVATARSTHGDLLRAWVEAYSTVSKSGTKSALIEALTTKLTFSGDYQSFVRAVEGLFASNDTNFQSLYSGFDEDRRAWAEMTRDITAALGQAISLEIFLQELDMRSKEPSLGPDVIPLLTVHGSKGNEFNHVYVAGLADEIFPSFQSVSRGADSPEMEEERRNCFVAITRCRESLTLTYAGRYRGYRKTPSRFLREMGWKIPAEGASGSVDR